MAYLGRPASAEVSVSGSTDTFTGDGNVAFTLSRVVKDSNPSLLEVFVSNVQQQPSVSFSIASDVLTFTTAPSIGEPIYVTYRDYNVAPVFTVPDGAISTSKIQNGAITADKIADGTIIPADISDGAVTESKLATDAVTQIKIADASISEAKLATGSVTETKIADDAVTETKLGANAVVEAKITDGAVTLGKISNFGDAGNVLISVGNAWVSGRAIVSGTAVASTSGNVIDFVGIPSWVKRITVMFNGVSTNGSSSIQVQIGDSGGIETTSYVAGSSFIATTVNTTNGAAWTSGFGVTVNISAATTISGLAQISNLSGNTWTYQFVGAYGGGSTAMAGGVKTLSDILDRIRITTVNGTDTFDAGSINILFE